MFKKFAELFLTFAKVGVMTFGGGYAMLPILQREVVENKGWAAEEELTDYFAIGQCTPGIIAVNTATFIGRKQLGFWGALAATLGVVFPSLVIIITLAGIITSFVGSPYVANAFAGIRVCVCVLIFNAVCKLLKKAVVDRKTAALYVVILAMALVIDASPVVFVLFAAAAGIVLHLLAGKGDAVA
jgi:chromate transporter